MGRRGETTTTTIQSHFHKMETVLNTLSRRLHHKCLVIVVVVASSSAGWRGKAPLPPWVFGGINRSSTLRLVVYTAVVDYTLHGIVCLRVPPLRLLF